MLTADYDRLGLSAGETILDLGCGHGRHAYEALRRGAHVVACDLGLEELRQVRSIGSIMRSDGDVDGDVVLETANGDATRLPFADASFDRIIASEVVEHIDDDENALAELVRVLRPGGVLAVTIPAHLPERICWALSDEYHAPNQPGGHVRIYARGELRAKMAAAGLNPFDEHRVHALHSPYWWLRCAVGPTRPIEESRMVSMYHRLLTWDIVKAPRATRIAEQLLAPVLGKSLVIYARRPLATGTATDSIDGSRPSENKKEHADVAT
ncbi:MAG TPA: SAM-dependent methyltransferase [Acidimicrobiaceae bacterium]|nr:SAM-dependent methyltransferase [Acidimicrobiaceae bacterium]HCV34850.1 SAM-dependent methyltransferase [Acidimicrobiaceae bacterium]